jgi:peptidoglycan/LPS O-acetylase OafA/YrhL
MRILKTRKGIMAVAAIFIAAYHLWIPVFPAGALSGKIEHFTVTTAYMGVDLFFFLSAYALTFSKITSKRKFVFRRFGKMYPVFLLFCVSALIMGKLSFPRFFATVVFLDFLRNGGGSFLWFTPALLMMYLVFPYCRAALSKYSPAKRLVISLSVWAAMAFAVEYGLRGVVDVSIFLCRIPAIFLGVFFAEYESAWSKRRRITAGVTLFLPGLIFVYLFGYLDKLTVPFESMFYIVALPCVLGLVFLLDVAFQGYSSKAIDALGGATLEMYCLQMLAGGELVSALLRLTHVKILTNLLSFTVLITSSLALAAARRYIARVKPS